MVEPNGIDVEQARARLEDERTQLQRSLGHLAETNLEDGAIAGTADAAAETATADEELELRVELEAQLAEVDAALARIDDGSYGIDEVTGAPIDPARLDAIPTARRNI